uniref:Uncharacterized protein n=1 Tax=Mantoniella antarctica TaxID=81844 RepID=A0A7S0SZS9_9CHLO
MSDMGTSWDDAPSSLRRFVSGRTKKRVQVEEAEGGEAGAEEVGGRRRERVRPGGGGRPELGVRGVTVTEREGVMESVGVTTDREKEKGVR